MTTDQVEETNTTDSIALSAKEKEKLFASLQQAWETRNEQTESGHERAADDGSDPKGAALPRGEGAAGVPVGGEPADARGRQGRSADAKDDPSVRNLYQFLKEADYRVFLDPYDKAYVSVRANGRRETWAVGSKNLKRWLRNGYFKKFSAFPSKMAFEDVIEALEGEAEAGGAVEEVHVRVAGHGGNIYLDLADKKRTVIEITPEGWKPLAGDPPVSFRRPKAMHALVEPERGGELRDLQKLLNLGGEHNWMSVIAWMVGALNPNGPYPILVLYGPEDSSKSFIAKVLHRLLDDNEGLLRSLPTKEDSMRTLLRNNWLVVLDNLSDIKPAQSDLLCRVATGTALGDREFYQQDDEYLFTASRPIVLNGIPLEMIKRPDLLRRTLLVELPAFADDPRHGVVKDSERRVWPRLEAAFPKLLGALLDAVAEGLKNLPNTNLGYIPGMADFVEWVEACSPQLWGKGRFLQHMRDQVKAQRTHARDQWPVAKHLVKFFKANTTAREPTLTQGVADLYKAVCDLAKEDDAKKEGWPKSSSSFSAELRRQVGALKEAGLSVTFPKRTSTGQKIVLSPAGSVGDVGDAKTPTSSKVA
jgi:hypothetical protein